MAPHKKRKSSGKISSVKHVSPAALKQNKKNGKKSNNIPETKLDELFIPQLGTAGEQERGRRSSGKNKATKSCPERDIEIVGNENVVSVDFIPLATHAYPCVREVSDALVSSSTSENCSAPETITVDDNDNESVCLAEIDCSSDSDCDSVNDSVQIVEEKSNPHHAGKCMGQSDRISNSMQETAPAPTAMKRKFDDSIEILETFNSVTGRTFKKARHTLSSPPISSTVITNSEGETRNVHEDDDIVIVDTVDNSRNSVEVVNDFIPVGISSSIVREKNRRRKIFEKKRNTRWNRIQKEGWNAEMSQPIVFQDTIGNVSESSARYKSPLSIANQDSDQNALYHNVYGNNVYNPNSVQKTGLRPVVIDGSNVAYGHGGKSFSTRGIEICVNYFVKRGHWVVAFVPLFRRSEVSDADRKTLDDLKKQNQLAFTPSRFLNGRRVASYDDRFIVQCAAELGGIVVSTDNYRDLVCENEAWRETIEKRLLMFTWVGDLLMFPDDPNGRGGPRLEEFLRFPQ